MIIVHHATLPPSRHPWVGKKVRVDRVDTLKGEQHKESQHPIDDPFLHTLREGRDSFEV